MTLSICIPSYNRPEFLRWTLERLQSDFAGQLACQSAEIVVRDDASTEAMTTWHLSVHQPWRWIQGRQNVGAFSNLREVLLEAQGKYAIYCANDDYLLVERVIEGMEYLDAHPEVVAYIAPCEIWDEVNHKSFWPAFKSEERTFTWDTRMELFNFIIEKHVWPEHIIYRTPVPYKPFTRAFWCFASLPELLDSGDIHFSGKPFYRNLLVHPVGTREQLGNVQCLTYFDEYRAGLEVMAFGFFGYQPYRCRHQIQEMISAFICQRMHNASMMYRRVGDTLNSEMLCKRIAIADPRRDQPAEQAA